MSVTIITREQARQFLKDNNLKDAKGMSTTDINFHMKKIYGLDMSAETVSRITDKILPIAKEWQNRPLQEFYPILYLDGMMFSVKQDGHIIKKTVYTVAA